MRTKDRLDELKQVSSDRAGAAVDGHYAATDFPSDITNLFQEVDQMRWWIHELNGNTQLIKRLHSDATFHNNKNLQDQLDSVISQSNSIGLKVCGALRQFESRASARDNGTRSRIARLQYAATRQLYADALAAHHRALQHVRDVQLNLLQEQIKLTNLTISDEECEALLDSKNISLFVDNVAAETAEARLALRDAEARHEQLTRVEHSLREVRDLFVQLAHLVATQQDRIDSVEYYALQATDLIGEGGNAIYKGTVKRSKAKKKKMGLIICLVSGFVIVLLVLICT